MKAEIKESQETGNGNGNGKVSKSYYWFSPCVPAGSSVFDQQNNHNELFFFFFPAHSKYLLPVSVVRRTKNVSTLS